VRAAWSRRTDLLVRGVASGCRPRFQLELAHWLEDNGRFQTFVSQHQDKVRKKLGTADEEARLDVRAELLVAHRLLSDRRFEVAFEAYGAQRVGPDLSVAFRTNQRFNVEVTRLRGTNGVDAPRLAHVVAGKLRQLPVDVANVVVITGQDLAITPQRLSEGARILKSRSDARYPRLGGVLALEEPAAVNFWPNPEARHPLQAQLVSALLASLRG
jgi:hypothetical protein